MESFYRFITPLLGTLIGVLVALPAAAAGSGPIAWILAPMGALVGYKNRHSRLFFYFSLFCVSILSGVVGLSLFES